MVEAKNVLVIIIDQLRADCVEGALASHVDLPNIDALKKDAVTFASHFSVVNPCGPSRASILTGRYSMNHRSSRNGAPLASGISNIALEVRKKNYEPLLFGYTDTSFDPRDLHPNDPDLKTDENVLPGFREIVEMRWRSSFPWRADLLAKGYDISSPENIYVPIPDQPDRPPRPDDPAVYNTSDSGTAFLTDRFISEMSVRTDKSWFALLSYISPHPPLVAPAPYNNMYAKAEIPMPERMNSMADEMAVHPFLHHAAVRFSAKNMSPFCRDQIDPENDEDVNMLRSVYLGMVSEVDAHIGRVVEFLKESGQYDNTMIILQADHGEMLGDHHMWDKMHVFDPAFKVPLIIRDPDNSSAHGTIVSEFSESVDIAPTILDWIEQPVPTEMDGVSLKPLLEGKDPKDWRDFVHLELDFGDPLYPSIWQKQLGISLDEANLAILREQKFKLVHFNGGMDPLLYDMEADPFEMNNLAANPEFAPVLLRLTQKLLSHRMKHQDKTLGNIRITPDGAVGSLTR
ncbi:MAG: alkaline phosphatase family protein [Devosiaceae bacterium]|nr:alkaline phosphatase family protein [Devosiaceae bacterium]